MPRAAVAEEYVRASVLPGVNTLVRITVGSGSDPDAPALATEVPSRVEDLVTGVEAHDLGWPADIVWVACPRYGGDVEIPERGTACRLSWPTPVGLYELPTSFEGRDMVGPAVRAWRLRVRGPAVRAQRRRYVRVPWTGAVTIELPGPVAPPEPGTPGTDRPDGAQPSPTGSAVPTGGARTGESPTEGSGAPGTGGAAPGATGRVLAGTMVDLGEGGIRCLLPPPPLSVGQSVRVVLPVAGQVLTPRARVVWTRACTTPVSTFAETGFAFDDPEEHGDLLRRVLFGEQLRARRAGLI